MLVIALIGCEFARRYSAYIVNPCAIDQRVVLAYAAFIPGGDIDHVYINADRQSLTKVPRSFTQRELTDDLLLEATTPNGHTTLRTFYSMPEIKEIEGESAALLFIPPEACSTENLRQDSNALMRSVSGGPG